MISKRQKNWHIYAMVHTFLFLLIGLIGGVNSINKGFEDSTSQASLIIGLILIILFLIAPIWIIYLIISSSEKSKLSKKILRIKNSELVNSEYRPKIESLENLFSKGAIDAEKYYSHLNKLVEAAEKIIRKDETVKRIDNLFNKKIENLRDSLDSGLISQKEYDLRVRNLEERLK
jgi:hypothetical protein